MAYFDLIDWNAVALGAIATIRVPVYSEPRLLRGNGKRTAKGRRGPDAEHKRRNGTRELNQELSRYYKLSFDEPVWTSSGLLLKGKHGRDRSPS